MVFLIQTSQNRDSAALQAKLDELIRVGTAQNLFVGLEHLPPEEIAEIRRELHGHLERRRRPAEGEAAQCRAAPLRSRRWRLDALPMPFERRDTFDFPVAALKVLDDGSTLSIEEAGAALGRVG